LASLRDDSLKAEFGRLKAAATKSNQGAREKHAVPFGKDLRFFAKTRKTDDNAKTWNEY